MITPSQLFNETKEVIEVVEETIEDKQTLEEDISHSVSLIDGAFRNIQEQILSSNKKELSVYKNQVLEVYNLCNDIKENQLPKYKKEVLQSDLKTESRIRELKKELYETLEERLEETKETIKVFFREEVKDLNKLRSSVIAVEEYIKNTPNTIFELREQVFKELRKSTDANEELIKEKLDKIGYEYEVLQEGLLNEPPSTKTNDSLTPLDQNFVTFEQLQQHYKVFVNRVQQQMATVGGGGEVRLEFLDDVDRTTAKVDGKVLAWSDTVGKFIGTTMSPGGITTETQTLNTVLGLGNVSSRGMSVGVVTATSFFGDGSNLSGLSTFSGSYTDLSNRPTLFSGSYTDLSDKPTLFSGDYGSLTNAPTGIVTDGRGTVGQLLQHDGSSFVGLSSEAYSDFVTDCSQGYYAYTTDYYTVGVANTVQELVEDTWNLLQPQVAAQYNHQTHQMQAANGGSPWVGTGATIGTGQTTFSLAGMGDGANCLVRIAFRFTPDVDDSDMDIRLNFTTNTATQGTGLTNFSITKQALVVTQGADEEYPGEILIPFFVGSTLSGINTTNAGKFNIEVNPSDEGDLEVLAVTVAVDN